MDGYSIPVRGVVGGKNVELNVERLGIQHNTRDIGVPTTLEIFR